MAESNETLGSIRFGRFDLSVETGELRKDSVRLKLSGQAVEVLLLLVVSPGKLVTREELQRKLWPGESFGDFEHGLNAAVNRLREALGDSADNPKFVETVPRRGYRFRGKIEGAVPSLPPNKSLRAYLAIGVTWEIALASALVLLSVASAMFWASKRGSRVEPAVVPLVSSLGDKQGPVLSPDGNELAFSWQGEKTTDAIVYHIYVQLVGAGAPIRITDASASDFDPVWSPDGRFIAFVQPTGQSIAYYVIPALGGPERKITESYPDVCGGLSWSPDGKYLAVVDRNSPNGSQIGIFFVSVESGEKRQSGIQLPAPFVSSLAFSPDGKYLAFVSGSGFLSNDIYVASTSGGKSSLLTSVRADLRGLAWAADSQQIVFSSNHEGLRRLWRVPLGGGTPEPLAIPVEDASEPTISGRGNRLAFLHHRADTNIWRASALAPEHQLPVRVIASTREDAVPVFSPDGQHIAFGSDRSGRAEIYICGSDGANPLQLTSMKSQAGAPSWSPDGKQIAFDSRREGHSDIFVIRSDGGSPRRLTSELYDSVLPRWSQDGRWIYFTSDRSGTMQIWKVPAAGGVAVQITKNGAYGGFEGVDGKSFYYYRYYRGQAIWKSTLAGDNETRLVGADDWQGFRLRSNKIWLLDYSGSRAKPAKFGVFDLFTRRERHLGTLDVGPPGNVAMGFDISPDGGTIVYTRVDALVSEIMLVEGFH